MSEAKAKRKVYSKTKDLYQKVIDNTCARMKSEFVERGISEYVIYMFHELCNIQRLRMPFTAHFVHSRDVLIQLRALWELHVAKSGAFGDPSKNTEVKVEEGGDKEQVSNQRCDFFNERIARTSVVYLISICVDGFLHYHPYLMQRINSWGAGRTGRQGVPANSEYSEWRFKPERAWSILDRQ